MAMIWEWDIPKEESRQKKIEEYTAEMMEYWNNIVKEKKIESSATTYTDNTGRMVMIGQYTYEDFSKWWNDEGWQKRWSTMGVLVDNASLRLLHERI